MFKEEVMPGSKVEDMTFSKGYIFYNPPEPSVIVQKDTLFMFRPYYEALEGMVNAQSECQKAAVQFQRAAGIVQPDQMNMAVLFWYPVKWLVQCTFLY